MKFLKAITKLVLALSVIAFGVLLMPLPSHAQTAKLGIVRYTSPTGMTKTVKDNVVAFSELNQTTGTFCIITLYGATPGTGNPRSDFAREWNNLVIKTMKKAEANPKTDEQKADGWTVVSGGGEVESDVGRAVGFLTVVSGSGQTISILAVFNDPAYVQKIDAFVMALDLDKSPPPANTAVQPVVENGKLVVPLPTRQLTIADLAGEWGEDAQRISTTYVDRSSGAYRGTDNLTFRSKMSFTRNGGYLNDFFAIQNGKKIIDKTTGTFSIDGRVLSIKQRNTARYVIRGWLELPDMTILVVCGPWYDADTIPPEIFTNPAQGANLNNTWVRKN